MVLINVFLFFFSLSGDLHPGPLVQELRGLQEKERKLDELIQICTWHIHQMCENQHTRKYPFCSVKDYHMHITPLIPLIIITLILYHCCFWLCFWQFVCMTWSINSLTLVIVCNPVCMLYIP